MAIEALFQHWKHPRIVLYLHAPAEVLRARVVQRENATPTPPLDWFKRVLEYFDEFVDRMPHVVRLSTEAVNTHDVVIKASALLTQENTKG